MDLLGLVFSEFETIVGPKIVHQVPENLLTPECFSNVSDYLVADKELAHKVITLFTSHYTLVAYAVRIENKKYHRNYLLFNVAFILKPKTRTLHSYEPLVRKLAQVFETMEIESEFVFNPQSRSRIKDVLIRVYEQLSSEGECSILLNSANVSTLKLIPVFESPLMVSDHFVPVPLNNLLEKASNTWDLAIQRILPFIDGSNHVKRISRLANVDVDITRAALRQLSYFDLVRFVDIFQYSNCYAVDSPDRLLELGNNSDFQKKCVLYCCSEALEHSFSTVFSIICQITERIPVKEVVMKSLDLIHRFQVHIERLVVFCVLNRVLRRIHKFPVVISTHESREMSSAPALGADKGQEGAVLDSRSPKETMSPETQMLLSSLNGERCLDEIACALDQDPASVEARLSRLRNCVFIQK